MRWVNKHETSGEIKRNNRPPVAYKLHKEQVKYVLDEIKKNKTITMDDLLVKLKEKYPMLTLSRFHLSRVVSFYDFCTNTITNKIGVRRRKCNFSKKQKKELNRFCYKYIGSPYDWDSVFNTHKINIIRRSVSTFYE